MLKRVDRVQIAVRDRTEAERVLAQVLGAEPRGRDQVKTLAARRTTMQAGASLIELLEADGTGPVADHLGRFGGGLFAAGFSVDDLGRAQRHLEGAGAGFAREGGQLLVDPSSTFGMRAVLSVHEERAPVGAIRWIYEVTNVIGDWRAAAERYARLFGLDRSKFVPITSAAYGYTGTLAMFDAPAWLDRIELSQVTEPHKAMGRFHGRRGDSLYMFYVEADDVDAVAARLQARGGRFAPGARDGAGMAGLFIHPTALCGVLVGVSRTEHAWSWSGDPERARRAARAR